MLFIYWLEDHATHAKRVQHILARMQERQDVLCTSTFTLAELLTGAYRRAATELADRIRAAFESSEIEMIPFGVETAEHYALIRGRFGFSPPDAIHLACAAQAKADLFLTNDQSLIGKGIPGIQFIAGMDTELF